jgi:hypothetical protein
MVDGQYNIKFTDCSNLSTTGVFEGCHCEMVALSLVHAQGF